MGGAVDSQGGGESGVSRGDALSGSGGGGNCNGDSVGEGDTSDGGNVVVELVAVEVVVLR